MALTVVYTPSLEDQIEEAMSAGEYAKAALLSAEIPHAADHLKAMIRIHAASVAAKPKEVPCPSP